MGYIGRSVDKISNIETLDNITFDGSSSYSLTKNSVAFSPSASQNILISIDGVVQSGNFTVSGSTIDFGVAISSSSVCNFIIHLGVGIVTAPSDGSVGTSQLASSAVTNAKIASDAAIATTKLGTGAVLQVKHYSDNSNTATSSTVYQSTGVSIDITPSSTSNKILIIASAPVYAASTSGEPHITIFRDSTNLATNANAGFSDSFNNAGAIIENTTIHYLDSPSTTSQITYEIKLRRDTIGTTYFGVNNVMRTMTCMEIAG